MKSLTLGLCRILILANNNRLCQNSALVIAETTWPRIWCLWITIGGIMSRLTLDNMHCIAVLQNSIIFYFFLCEFFWLGCVQPSMILWSDLPRASKQMHLNTNTDTHKYKYTQMHLYPNTYYTQIHFWQRCACTQAWVDSLEWLALGFLQLHLTLPRTFNTFKI